MDIETELRVGRQLYGAIVGNDPILMCLASASPQLDNSSIAGGLILAEARAAQLDGPYLSLMKRSAKVRPRDPDSISGRASCDTRRTNSD